MAAGTGLTSTMDPQEGQWAQALAENGLRGSLPLRYMPYYATLKRLGQSHDEVGSTRLLE